MTTSGLFDGVGPGTPAPFARGSGAWCVIAFLRRNHWGASGAEINAAGLALSFRSRVSDIRTRLGAAGCFVNQQGTTTDAEGRRRRATVWTVPPQWRDRMSALAPEG